MSDKDIIAFGYHDQKAQRYYTLHNQYCENFTPFIECHTNDKGLIRKYIDLINKYKQNFKRANTVIVMFPGHIIMPLAWILTRFPRKKLIFDAFISLWDTQVDDRKIYSNYHPMSLILYITDFISCHLADEVLVDTEEHKKYFISMFKILPDRIKVIYLETRNDIFTRKDEKLHAKNDLFEVLFFGSFIPLQGIEYILDSAEILKKKNMPIHFTFIGSGQTRKEMENLSKNKKLDIVSFKEKIPIGQLPNYIRNADLCLGIFGTTGKASRVIPHKVLDAIACGVPVLTRDSEAIRERFSDGNEVMLCKAGSGEAIAQKIEEQYKKYNNKIYSS